MKYFLRNKLDITDIMTLTGANMFGFEVAGLKKIQETIASLKIRVFCNRAGFLKLFELISEGRTEKFIESMKSMKCRQDKVYLLQGDGKIHQY